MRMTNETVIDPELVELFYKIYARAFEPIESRAAARHLLSFEEFAGEMADERIEKHVLWDGDGEPVGLATYTRDLSAIPWISPAFYARRYPEAAARNALVYMGYSLVHPDHQGRGAYNHLLEDAVRTVRAVDGVGVFDVCSYNDANVVGHMHQLIGMLGHGGVEKLDTQTYYAATFNDSASYVNRDREGAMA